MTGIIHQSLDNTRIISQDGHVNTQRKFLVPDPDAAR